MIDLKTGKLELIAGDGKKGTVRRAKIRKGAGWIVCTEFLWIRTERSM